MAATRQRTRPKARPCRNADVIVPEHRARVTHFRPVFPNLPIIDAEFEDIASEPGAAGDVNTADPAARFDDRRSHLRFPGWKIRLPEVESRLRPRLFPVALVGLCAISFWVFGGHAVLARLTGGADAGAEPLVISSVSTRIGTIDGMRMAIVDGQVTNTTSARQNVPAIGVRAGGRDDAVEVRASDHVLGAGASTAFRAKLPMAEGRTPAVDVTFIDTASDAER